MGHNHASHSPKKPMHENKRKTCKGIIELQKYVCLFNMFMKLKELNYFLFFFCSTIFSAVFFNSSPILGIVRLNNSFNRS